ncbi:MAG TPA: hypothetical protein VE619_03695 [Nitrososphaeraceae archaeon]|nr:hypothetical protein [Nitrososphaeraceae archaeon]
MLFGKRATLEKAFDIVEVINKNRNLTRPSTRVVTEVTPDNIPYLKN